MTVEVKVPDIGDFKEIPIIEIMVKAGDHINKDAPLITLESDKATMEVPAPQSGVVSAIHVKLGDKVSEGTLILSLEANEATAQAAPPKDNQTVSQAAVSPAPVSTPTPAPVNPPAAAPSAVAAASVTVKVPDIGDFKDIPIIEIMVKAGDRISKDAPLVTLESDKATMEVPAPEEGVVEELLVKLGDRVSEGHPILTLKSSQAVQPTSAPATAQSAQPTPVAAPVSAPVAPTAQTTIAPAKDETSAAPVVDQGAFIKAHASPSVRQFARELGVDLSKLKGSGPKGRILKEDVQAFVKAALSSVKEANTSGVAAGVGLGLLPWPQVDFAKFGAIEVQPLSRIKKISGANLHRNWVMIPHVTNNDDADITELEAFRVQLNTENQKSGTKVTMLAFLIKAVCNALRKFPQFNASLDGDNLVLKHYYHIGFAADTPNGLVVPVIKEADKKGVLQIAEEAQALAKKAREGKLSPADMQGGTFSISSLGGIGGTYFTPIINAPEVAILGVCRSVMKPVWRDNQFQPRLILPLSLSYDHRVIDGALAARFNAYLVELLADLRRATL